MKKVLAIDLGASSGRGILGIYDGGTLTMEEINRFSYEPVIGEKYTHWDIDFIFRKIVETIKKASEFHDIDAVGVDTWGVDYGLIGADGKLLEAPIHYRDPRTKGMLEAVCEIVDEKSLFESTGTQLMEINTIFQLKEALDVTPEKLKATQSLLMMPNLINYLLTGEKFTEVSIASTSGLMNPVNKKWHVDVMNQLGLPIHIFPEIVNEGTHVGQLLPELGLKSIPVVHVCSHDTASAFVNATDDAYFISCGTWSLIGVEKNEPALTETVRKFNMTNESGIDETTRLLKNITGLWIIQELKRDFTRLGKNYDYSDFERLARDATPWQYIINTEDSRFLEPNDMIKKIHDYLFETNQGVPVDDGALIRLIYESLALKYKETLEQLADVNGKPLNKIKMVGGGIQSKILCEMVASATNLPVEAGPIEATALGNIGVMLMTVGCFDEVSTMRKWLKGFSDVVFYEPTDVSGWQAQYEKFEVLMKTVIS